MRFQSLQCSLAKIHHLSTQQAFSVMKLPVVLQNFFFFLFAELESSPSPSPSRKDSEDTLEKDSPRRRVSEGTPPGQSSPGRVSDVTPPSGGQTPPGGRSSDVTPASGQSTPTRKVSDVTCPPSPSGKESAVLDPARSTMWLGTEDGWYVCACAMVHGNQNRDQTTGKALNTAHGTNTVISSGADPGFRSGGTQRSLTPEGVP